MKECLSLNINLLQIWEDDWIHKNEIIKSIILNKFNLNTNKIGSRRCLLKDISYKESIEFLNKNHIQGNCPSTYRIGLYYNDDIVSLMTFGTRYINKMKSLELLRFCNKLNTSVMGSFNKLFKSFTKNLKTKEFSIIKTYSDNSLFTGEIYKKNGFVYKGYTNINYYWCDKKNMIKYHRYSFSKKKLVSKGFDILKTEDKIMTERGYIKIWGAGQKLWEYKL